MAGFEWDPAKRESNLVKHGIDFVDAIAIFDGFVLRLRDPRGSYGEVRFVAIGQVGDQLLAVVCTPRPDAIRIISARRANRHETRAYRAVRPQEA
ncbi:MAG: BrnT family toxin [Gemmatimonadales bacterium]